MRAFVLAFALAGAPDATSVSGGAAVAEPVAPAVAASGGEAGDAAAPGLADAVVPAAAVGGAAGAPAEVPAEVAAPPTFRRGGGELALFADASIASELTLVSVGVRGGYFVRAGFEVGAELQATLLVPPRGSVARPTSDAPGGALRVTPLVRWMPLRSESFAAYLLAGIGPTVLGREALAHVLVAPGALVHVGGRVWLELAIRFTRGFPGGRCRAAFAGQVAPGFCEFQFGPQLGLAAAF